MTMKEAKRDKTVKPLSRNTLTGVTLNDNI